MNRRTGINPMGMYIHRHKTHVDRHRRQTRRVPIFRAKHRDRMVGSSKYDPATEDRKHAAERARGSE